MGDLKLLIDKKDINGIREYLSNGININDVTIDGFPVLAYSMLTTIGCEYAPQILNHVPNNSGDDIILLLIEAGADVNYFTEKGMSLLLVALTMNRSYEVICRLIKEGCSVNYTYFNLNALNFAFENNCDKRIISKLIYEGANVNQCDVSGRTPLFHAVKNNDLQVVKWLVDAGGDINARELNLKNLLMVVSCKNCCKNNCESRSLIDFLMKRHIDITAVDIAGNSIVHIVDCMYLIDLAIKHGVSIDSKNISGLTPLMSAVYFGDTDKTNNILKFKPDVNYCTSDE